MKKGEFAPGARESGNMFPFPKKYYLKVRTEWVKKKKNNRYRYSTYSVSNNISTVDLTLIQATANLFN